MIVSTLVVGSHAFLIVFHVFLNVDFNKNKDLHVHPIFDCYALKKKNTKNCESLPWQSDLNLKSKKF